MYEVFTITELFQSQKDELPIKPTEGFEEIKWYHWQIFIQLVVHINDAWNSRECMKNGSIFNSSCLVFTYYTA